MTQLRRRVKQIYHELGKNGVELVCGSNTTDIEMLAVGEIISHNTSRWLHLHIKDVKKIIEDYENGIRGSD